MKYGFVYIWFDKKYKRYYVGRHWGAENDGYICSSVWMRNSYNRRPTDFKRRIIKRIHTTQQDLVEEEQKWLSMIKPSECGNRYYNKTRKAGMPSMLGRKHSSETIQKIKESNIGKKRSSETRKKISEGNRRPCSESRKNSLRKPRSEEFKRKVSEGMKLAWKDGKTKGNKNV